MAESQINAKSVSDPALSAMYLENNLGYGGNGARKIVTVGGGGGLANGNDSYGPHTMVFDMEEARSLPFIDARYLNGPGPHQMNDSGSELNAH